MNRPLTAILAATALASCAPKRPIMPAVDQVAALDSRLFNLWKWERENVFPIVWKFQIDDHSPDASKNKVKIALFNYHCFAEAGSLDSTRKALIASRQYFGEMTTLGRYMADSFAYAEGGTR